MTTEPERITRSAGLAGVATLAYILVVVAKWSEPNRPWRIGLLIALAGLTAVLHFGSPRSRVPTRTVLNIAHLVLALLSVWGAGFGTWTKRGNVTAGAVSGDGGSGFGVAAVVLGILLLGLALLRVAGRTVRVMGLGVEQLTATLGLLASMNVVAFIVGWLATFEAGTGWGVVVVLFASSLQSVLGLFTFAMREPAPGIRQRGRGGRSAVALVAVVSSLGITLCPFLAWLTSGNVSLSALDGKTGESLSGPRFGYILVAVGVIAVAASLKRVRPDDLVEPGSNTLLGHLLLTAGGLAIIIPLSTLGSIGLGALPISAGPGLWFGLASGLVLVGATFAESRRRGTAAA